MGILARAIVVAIVVLATACFSKPERLGSSPDAGDGDAAGDVSDAAPTTFTPRLVRNAYWSNNNGTPGMSATGFEVSTAGLVPGDLVLFIGSIDNGNDAVWPAIDAGFTQLKQRFYGNDGQTFVVAWKLAGSEPATYHGTYGPGIASAAATISLIAVSGADPVAPINASRSDSQTGLGAIPATGTSSGITTTVPDCLLLYASGADWENQDGTNTVQTPAGFTSLAEIGDKGDNDWQWTSQQVADRPHAPVGATGPITGSLTGSFVALAWTVVIAIAPAPL